MGRQGQCVNLQYHRASRQVDTVEIPSSTLSPRWGPCFSALGSNRTVSPRWAGQKGCAICHWQFGPFSWELCWQPENPSSPPHHHSSGKGQGQRGNQLLAATSTRQLLRKSQQKPPSLSSLRLLLRILLTVEARVELAAIPLTWLEAQNISSWKGHKDHQVQLSAPCRTT